MAKKSNKTEHVLRLITKNDEVSDDDFFGIEESAGDNGTAAVLKAVHEPTEDSLDQTKLTARPSEENELKIETKIKIEIEPEIEFVSKEPKIQVEPLREIKTESVPEAKPEPKEAPAPPAKIDVKQEPVVPETSAPQKRNTAAGAGSDDNSPLVNIAELLAKERIALVMERMKVCTCSTCYNDVLALALNSLPTKYVTTDAGKQFFQLDMYKKQYETDVLAALTKACVRVKAAPRHL